MARPLTKTDQQGHLYTRLSSVEAAIDAAMVQDLDTLARRAAVTNQLCPDFLPLECLVHLVREARRRGDEDVMSALLLRLLSRCDTILKKKIPTDAVGSWDDVRAEILGDFAVLFAEDGSDEKHTLDFYECRFHRAFRNFRIPYLRKEIARNQNRVFAPADNEQQPDLADDEFLSGLAEKMREPWPQVDLNLRQAIANALDELPRDQCKAVVLVYYHGLPIESDDPSITTVASVCGVTGRTIRNRISRALATLSKKFKDTRMKEERGNDDDLESPHDASR